MNNKKSAIAIYGLSGDTQIVLEQISKKYNIIGLLDGYKRSGEMYGQKIISLEDAILSGVEAIIVVARPSSRRIIVNRIGETCAENAIKLFDVYGHDLLATEDKKGNLCIETHMTRLELLEKINKSDVVSFDIFDTLVTRNVLYPTDVFKLVEEQLVTKYGQGYDFANKREQVERELSKNGVPTICDIYRQLEKQTELSSQLIEEIRKIEWQIECRLIVPRYDMCEILRYAVGKQKKVYLISDMYYSSNQLNQLLTEKGITGYQKIIVSCEYGMTKSQGLLGVLKQETVANIYMHIGDNYVADVVSAKQYGIDGVWIRSGIDMFDMMPWSKDFDESHSLEERVKLGLFISRMFNSPFVLENGNISIEQPEDLGYLLLAPILTDFCLWLLDQLKDTKDINVLFSARDGYLIKTLYDILADRKKNVNNRTIYFLISRISAVGASLFSAADVAKFANMDFSGSFNELLKIRFMLSDKDIDKLDGDIVAYTDTILHRAAYNRNCYKKYIKSLQIDHKEIIFYDFVSSGTCQVALEKIMDKKIQGYYFMRVKDEDCEKKQLSIEAFYDDKDTNQLDIYEYYFVLENILTSPMPSLKGFDDEGNPRYVEEIRTVEELDFIDKVHKGIIQYFREYLDVIENFGKISSRKCSEKMLRLLHKIPIKNDIFKDMVWEDGFFQRTGKVSDLM